MEGGQGGGGVGVDATHVRQTLCWYLSNPLTELLGENESERERESRKQTVRKALELGEEYC